MVFAPSAALTDDPAVQSLYLADSGTVDTSGSIIEFSLAAPTALPPGTTLLPASLVHIIDTSKTAWSPFRSRSRRAGLLAHAQPLAGQ